MPFTPDEVVAILGACDTARLRAFVLLLRYSGLRVGDVATLAKDRIQNGKLLLYTQKTGVPVYLSLPQVVLDALESFPHMNEQYYFWGGASTKGGVART